MKIITLWQPWASFIALGWKTIETRTHNKFKVLVGHTIGIHASNTWDKDWNELAGPYLTQMQREEVGYIKNLFDDGHLRGEILCTAHVNMHRIVKQSESNKALIFCSDKFLDSRYGLFLTDIKPIVATPAKGKQGIWNYPFIPKYLK